MNESAKKTFRTAVRELNKPVTMLMMLIAAFSDVGDGNNGSDDGDSMGGAQEAKQTVCACEEGMMDAHARVNDLTGSLRRLLCCRESR